MSATHSDVVSRIVDAHLTLEFMHALGWQGGTVHQVADEIIKRELADVDVYHALLILSDVRYSTLAAKYGHAGAQRLIESGRVKL